MVNDGNNSCPNGCQVIIDTGSLYVYGPLKNVININKMIGAYKEDNDDWVSADSDYNTYIAALILNFNK